MIESFKSDAMDRKEAQINMKTTNAAQQFRKINIVQKEMEQKQKRIAEERELRDEQRQLAKDLIDFRDHQHKLINEMVQRKKTTKNNLTVGMAIKEERKENERIREAMIDAKNKDGPPMMIEIEQNQNNVEQNTKKIN